MPRRSIEPAIARLWVTAQGLGPGMRQPLKGGKGFVPTYYILKGACTMAQNEYAVRLEHVTKTFGPVVANKDVSLGVRRGEILALLGENGSGKTTLMNMLAGIYFPDEGEIYVDGKAVTIRSPKDALDLGIGMIHQHFKLVDVFTATENIVLGRWTAARSST